MPDDIDHFQETEPYTADYNILYFVFRIGFSLIFGYMNYSVFMMVRAVKDLEFNIFHLRDFS